MLLDGHTIVYEPRAAVRHSHEYSLREAFRRFYASGASADRTLPRRGAIAGRAPGAQAVATRRRAALALAAPGNARWIPFAVLYELSKLAGLTLGRRQGSRQERLMAVERERIADDARAPKWVRHEHLARYEFAAGYADGAVVVDCACGDGTCARILSPSGARDPRLRPLRRGRGERTAARRFPEPTSPSPTPTRLPVGDGVATSMSRSRRSSISTTPSRSCARSSASSVRRDVHLLDARPRRLQPRRLRRDEAVESFPSARVHAGRIRRSCSADISGTSSCSARTRSRRR